MIIGPVKQKTKKKFRKKVLIIFVIISILPLFIISGTNIYLIIMNRQQAIFEQQHLAIDNASNKITKYFQEKSQGLSLVVSAPILSIQDLGFNDINFLLKNSFETSRPLSLDFADNQGIITAKISPSGEYYYNRAYLARFGTSSPLGLSIQNTISDSEADVSSSPDFQTAIAGNSYYGLLEFANGSPVMRIASQIKNQEEKIIGVISAEIDLRDIEKLISEITLGQEGFVYAVDRQGALIASGNKKIGQIGSPMHGHQLIKQIQADNHIEKKFQTYLSPINETVVWSAGLLPSKDWIIISEWPITDAFSVLKNLFFWSSLIALLILILVLVSAIIFTRTITRPISLLTKGAEEIKAGNLKHAMNLQTGDEFELLGNQFNEMIKVLNENQRLRDEFVFIAAHELRTPVTAIRGYLEMILEGIFGKVSEPVSKNLRVIQKANDNLVELVQNLLEIARNEAGKMTIEMIDIDLNEKINSVIDQLQSLAIEKKIKINFSPLNETELIKADSGKLNEVLVNIIGNAIKYTTNDGSIEIKQEINNDFVITHIKDHGIGMTKEDLAKLFSKFYRVKNAETSSIQGTGLGLFITKEIVERMEGEIWVKSEKGVGSTFSFSLKKSNQ